MHVILKRYNGAIFVANFCLCRLIKKIAQNWLTKGSYGNTTGLIKIFVSLFSGSERVLIILYIFLQNLVEFSIKEWR